MSNIDVNFLSVVNHITVRQLNVELATAPTPPPANEDTVTLSEEALQLYRSELTED